jgi:hypothetical protein
METQRTREASAWDVSQHARKLPPPRTGRIRQRGRQHERRGGYQLVAAGAAWSETRRVSDDDDKMRSWRGAPRAQRARAHVAISVSPTKGGAPVSMA